MLYNPPHPSSCFVLVVLLFLFLFVCLLLILFLFFVLLLFGLWFVASDLLTTICHLAIVNVCVIIMLSKGNTQISILLFCFLYLFVEFMMTKNE